MNSKKCVELYKQGKQLETSEGIKQEAFRNKIAIVIKMYYGCERKFRTEFSKAIDEYIYCYNNERLQKKTKWMLAILYSLASIV